MVLDCHIHMVDQVDSPEVFQASLKKAGIDGGIIFSYQHAGFDNGKPAPGYNKKRLDQVMEFTSHSEHLYPFYWIDPMEEDAYEQVDMAVEAGVAGFKVICCNHYPQDDKAMKVWDYIAKKKKPVLFHSGILYNDTASCEFNRPGNFEYLFAIDNLRFALAHVSWPWHDELIAVFGKWNYQYAEKENGITASMYVDNTRGTPPIYREEVLRKLISIGYVSLPDHLMFGTDGNSHYNAEKYGREREIDNEIYRKYGVSEENIRKIYCDNILKFIKG